MMFPNALLSAAALALCLTTAAAKPCGVTYQIECVDGQKLGPLSVDDNYCITNVCRSHRGIKQILPNSGGCNSWAVYGSTDCSNSYSSTKQGCRRHDGLTSGNAAWYSIKAHC